MKHDRKIVSLFLNEYHRLTGSTFKVDTWLDDIKGRESEKKVEAVALDESGQRLAIEHTRLQPFVDEKEDAHHFHAAFGSLADDESLRLPNYMVTLSLSIGAIPK